uniref:ribonuclease H n=1 Tax=Podarcis muralis TaxID=64176 RepID=A0A670IUV5_PODMU
MDPEAINFISSFDIVCLQETWSQQSITLPYYCSFSSCARKLANRGRPQVGLACLISTSLSLTICEELKSSPYFLTIKIHLPKTKSPWLITTVYLPPAINDSDRNERWSELSSWLHDLQTTNPGLPQILLGDFNARIGPNDDAILSSAALLDNPLQHPWGNRCSLDPITNASGRLMAQLAIENDLCIANGNVTPLSSQQLTYISSRGTSVVDYILLTPELFSISTKMEVAEYFGGDHLPLTLMLSLIEPFSVPSNYSSTVQSYPVYKTKKWTSLSSSLALDIQKSLDMPTVLSDSIPPADQYRKLIDAFSTTYITITSPTHQRFFSESPWFDKECKVLRRRIRKMVRIIKFSNDPQTRAELLVTKRTYRNMIHCKKQQHILEAWSTLRSAVERHDSRSFWRLVRPSAPPNSAILISADEWIAYYSASFASPNNLTDHLQSPSDLCSRSPSSTSSVNFTSTRIFNIIMSMRRNKAPGPDMVPLDLFLTDPLWWSEQLTSVFTAISSALDIPDSWREATIVPIFKGGQPNIPRNYRPISLLSIPGKIFAAVLLEELLSWVHERNILPPEQIGFRKSASTMDHCLTLYHLASKYTAPRQGHLFAAFMDLEAAFDSIPRQRLWSKLAHLGIDPHLLSLIISLYSNTTARVRIGPNGYLTTPFPTARGVRQGCLLAPLLFNLYLHDALSPLKLATKYPPHLAGHPVASLFYADDAVILSRTAADLANAVNAFIAYCKAEALNINYKKSKVLHFTRSRKLKLEPLKITGGYLEKVKAFKYLGLIFTYNLSWTTHLQSASLAATTTSNAIVRFYHQKGGKHLPAAIQMFNAKVVPKLLYGCEVWTTAISGNLDCPLHMFLRSLSGVPRCVSGAALRLEFAQPSIVKRAWSRAISYSSHLLLSDARIRGGFSNLILRDIHNSPWKTTINLKFRSLLNLNRKTVFNLECISPAALPLIKKKLQQLDFSNTASHARGPCSGLALAIPPPEGIPLYCFTIPSEAKRRAFTCARLNCFPTAVLSGRYSRVPSANRTCSCNDTVLETMEHVMLFCPNWTDERSRFLTPLVNKLHLPIQPWIVSLLLQDSDRWITEMTANFLLSVMKRKAAPTPSSIPQM